MSFIDRHREQPFLLFLTSMRYTFQPRRRRNTWRFTQIEDEKRRTYAAILSADDNVGLVLDKLHDTKLDNDTLVFFISDNGGPPANEAATTTL